MDSKEREELSVCEMRRANEIKRRNITLAYFGYMYTSQCRSTYQIKPVLATPIGAHHSHTFNF